jgi:transposase-like protein
MAETRRKFDQDFKEGAVRLVRETGRPIAQVAKRPRHQRGHLGDRVNADRRRRGDGGTAPMRPKSGSPGYTTLQPGHLVSRSIQRATP